MNRAPSPHGEWVDPADADDLPEDLRGKRAYVPRPLKSDLFLPTETHAVLAMAEHTLGELNESTRRLPHRTMFALCTRLREVQNSAQLAGMSVDFSETWLTRLLLARAADDVEQQNLVLDRHPIGRVILAFEHGAARVADGAVVDGDLLWQVAGKLTGTTGGSVETSLRAHQSVLRSRSPEQPAILTTPPGGLLRSAFAQWSTWVGAPHPLSRIGRISLAHLNLVLLDPFPGTGDYLTSVHSSLAMVGTGLLRDQVLPLSSWLDEQAVEYYRRVGAVMDGGPIEDWIRFFALGVRSAGKAQLALIGELDALSKELLDQVDGSPTVQKVVAGLMTAPVTNNRTLEVMYGMANRTATQVTRQLVKAGVLEVVGGKSYNKVFVCQPVLDVYALQTPRAPASDRDVFAPSASGPAHRRDD
ncbi:hypothetical protein [Actinosynnema sp. NPDC020468]|uniref:Fic family protein n=1 Tax=Actinosynnema sp. NPDC020468 TaxID=3154488 RepID=UPI0033F0EEF5